jgi:t-SNARE complex subunit (syntaxin)
VQRISTLHAQSLNNMDPAMNQQNQAVLDDQVNATRGLSNDIKRRIQTLESRPSAGGDIRMQKNQVRWAAL